MSLKTITATVGEGCANIPADVATVQYLLNCVPVSQGGLVKKLKIDGFAGVVTIEAINRFQKFHFGLSDSRVQSGGETFSELKKYDLLPFSAPVIAPNFKPSGVSSMDPSKINKSVDFPGEGWKRVKDGVKRSVAGGVLTRNLYGGVADDSV